jgi:hypothetical protein
VAAGEAFYRSELAVAAVAEQLAACRQIHVAVVVLVSPSNELTAAEAGGFRHVFEDGVLSAGLFAAQERQSDRRDEAKASDYLVLHFSCSLSGCGMSFNRLIAVGQFDLKAHGLKTLARVLFDCVSSPCTMAHTPNHGLLPATWREALSQRGASDVGSGFAG